jgi:hypothetical protein
VCGKQTLPLFILGKSRMRKRARTDLCGGRSVMVVPTATVIQKRGCGKSATKTSSPLFRGIDSSSEGLVNGYQTEY